MSDSENLAEELPSAIGGLTAFACSNARPHAERKFARNAVVRCDAMRIGIRFAHQVIASQMLMSILCAFAVCGCADRGGGDHSHTQRPAPVIISFTGASGDAMSGNNELDASCHGPANVCAALSAAFAGYKLNLVEWQPSVECDGGDAFALSVRTSINLWNLGNDLMVRGTFRASVAAPGDASCDEMERSAIAGIVARVRQELSSRLQPPLPPLGAVHSIVASQFMACAIRDSDNAVYCWGNGTRRVEHARAQRIGTLRDVSELAIRDKNLCALTTGGVLRCVDVERPEHQVIWFGRYSALAAGQDKIDFAAVQTAPTSGIVAVQYDVLANAIRERSVGISPRMLQRGVTAQALVADYGTWCWQIDHTVRCAGTNVQAFTTSLPADGPLLMPGDAREICTVVGNTTQCVSNERADAARTFAGRLVRSDIWCVIRDEQIDCGSGDFQDSPRTSQSYITRLQAEPGLAIPRIADIRAASGRNGRVFVTAGIGALGHTYTVGLNYTGRGIVELDEVHVQNAP